METTNEATKAETQWQSPRLETLHTRLMLERVQPNCTGLLFVDAGVPALFDGVELPAFPVPAMISKHEKPDEISYYIHFSHNRKVELIGVARRAHAQAEALTAD